MAITYPLADPVALGFASATFGPVTTSRSERAPWTLASITQVFDGAAWEGSLNLMARDRREAAAMKAWLVALEGVKGTFLLGDPGAPEILGAAATDPGTPVVDGGSQTGRSLAIRGLPSSLPGWLLAGEYLQLGSGLTARLYMALETVDSDGSGEATVTIWPALRSSPSDGDAVTIAGPKGLFRLAAAANPWSVRQGLIHEPVTLACSEVVP